MKQTILLTLRITAAVFLLSSLYGCPVVRATGDTVEAVGEGAGHAVSETGRGVGHAVTGTGRAIERATD